MERAVLTQSTAPVLEENTEKSQLEGLLFSLKIEQDHADPLFATLLKEMLLSEGAEEVALLPKDARAADVAFVGDLSCNGYAEIYYQAHITCSVANQVLFTVNDRPAHGDRPNNLATELVSRLKQDLSKLIKRNERSRAIRELRLLP